jgi:diguanylate cyclase (GGDEF)-like protein/PAS domain S-box-containing protein
VALLSADGIMLARSADNGSYVGRDMSGTPLFRDLKSRPAAGIYYFTSPLDGLKRLSFYRLSNRYPIMVLATQSEGDVLAAWRSEALTHMAVVAGLVILIGLTGFVLVRQLLQRQQMAAALSAKEADFRLLAEQSSDMVMRIGLEETILYASPSSARVIGWEPAQLTGTPALGGVNAADLPRVRGTVSELKSGAFEEARVIYRTRHREKGEIWVESALRVTRAPDTGTVNGVVAISRDMTEHKDLEDKLAALASLDGLTGIANRRHLDERLTEEWARARREGTPLSLLMIDIDHFKAFNDQYGHQAGDDCLRAVARVLQAHARRPGDLAARYGGEEFALLMPGTEAEGCVLVGDDIREALHALAIPHAKNLPARRVSASLGGATNNPTGSAECASLIEAADRALYSAKEQGRNRMVMSGQVIAWPGSRSA